MRLHTCFKTGETEAQPEFCRKSGQQGVHFGHFNESATNEARAEIVSEGLQVGRFFFGFWSECAPILTGP